MYVYIYVVDGRSIFYRYKYYFALFPRARALGYQQKEENVKLYLRHSLINHALTDEYLCVFRASRFSC